MAVQWRGVFPAATTQFHQDQAVDFKSTLTHLDTMIDAGIHGLIMLGTVGENCALEYSEKLELLKATVAHVAGRVPVLSGVAECTTALACRFARDAQRAGVMGLMVLPAMVYKSDPRETMTHFRTVAAAREAEGDIMNCESVHGQMGSLSVFLFPPLCEGKSLCSPGPPNYYFPLGPPAFLAGIAFALRRIRSGMRAIWSRSLGISPFAESGTRFHRHPIGVRGRRR